MEKHQFNIRMFTSKRQQENSFRSLHIFKINQ